ncbi:MAG TPA: MBL fold metallo-hydrolase [Stellaceae bacterium]|nr:MBL fold metallo-hydrolase [Stellaceae bacterium]
MADTDTRVDEIADGIYRIATPRPPSGNAGGFTFCQYLIVDDEPLLFHTGMRRIFPLVRDAIARVMPVERLRWVSLSHFEADECGALNEFLAAAPKAEALCGTIAAMTSVNDFADRRARAMADGELLHLGRHTVRWLDTPHLPHAWECGFLMERTTRTLLCGDLFTEGGADHPPVSTDDMLEPSERFRLSLDYFSHTRSARRLLTRLAMEDPTTLARMHGSAWQGEGAKLLMALADRLEA